MSNEIATAGNATLSKASVSEPAVKRRAPLHNLRFLKYSADEMKKISDYHTHTKLCKHATGMPLDYVRQAERDGCSALGFSDHCPYPEDYVDVWQEIRMSVSDIPHYIESVQAAKEAASFPVYLGFECEWDKKYERWYRDELKGAYGADYLVLGSHWVNTETGHVGAVRIQDASDLHRYTAQTIEGMQSGLFAFLAHPDLFMATHKEWDADAASCLKAILDAAADLNLPIEVNGLGCSRPPNETARGMRYQYPYVEFWEMVSEANVRVICNSDAHDPRDVIMNAWKARDFAARFGITPIEKPDFETPKVVS